MGAYLGLEEAKEHVQFGGQSLVVGEAIPVEENFDDYFNVWLDHGTWSHQQLQQNFKLQAISCNTSTEAARALYFSHQEISV